MNSKRHVIDLYVMDALANDIEDLGNILQMLNSDTVLGWHRELGRRFTRADILQALMRLLRDDLVRALVLDESGKELEPVDEGNLSDVTLGDAYFELTGRGRITHGNWEPDTVDPRSAR